MLGSSLSSTDEIFNLLLKKKNVGMTTAESDTKPPRPENKKDVEVIPTYTLLSFNISESQGRNDAAFIVKKATYGPSIATIIAITKNSKLNIIYICLKLAPLELKKVISSF